MRIAITTRQPGPGGPLDCATDSRFGRSDGFVVADTETGEARYVDNAQGAAHARGRERGNHRNRSPRGFARFDFFNRCHIT